MSGEQADPGRFELPDEVEVQRSIGPFDAASLPKGLLREHRLKEGTWGRLRIASGQVRFVWDDAGLEGEAVVIVAGSAIIIPPTVPHHLELMEGDFSLEVDFLAQPR